MKSILAIIGIYCIVSLVSKALVVDYMSEVVIVCIGGMFAFGALLKFASALDNKGKITDMIMNVVYVLVFFLIVNSCNTYIISNLINTHNSTNSLDTLLKFDTPQISIWVAICDLIISICIIEPLVKSLGYAYRVNNLGYTKEQIQYREITSSNKTFGASLGFLSFLSIGYSIYTIFNLVKLDLATYDQSFTWWVILVQVLIIWASITWINLNTRRILCCSPTYWLGGLKYAMVPAFVIGSGIAIHYNNDLFNSILNITDNDCVIYLNHPSMCVCAHITILVGISYLTIIGIGAFMIILDKFIKRRKLGPTYIQLPAQPDPEYVYEPIPKFIEVNTDKVDPNIYVAQPMRYQY